MIVSSTTASYSTRSQFRNCLKNEAQGLGSRGKPVDEIIKAVLRDIGRVLLPEAAGTQRPKDDAHTWIT